MSSVTRGKFKFILAWVLSVMSINVFAESLREFPANTIFATISSVKYPEVTLQELPGNWGSSLLGMILLANRQVIMSPASIIRDQNNNTHVQNYLNALKNQPVAVLLDYQGRVGVIWQLTPAEIKFVIANKLNQWN